MKKSVKINGLLNVIQRSCHILIPLLTFPYLTRVLGSENFGKFSFANSIISYVILIAMLGVNSYSVREGARIRDNREALASFISEIFSINVISGFVAMFALLGIICLFPKVGEYEMLLYIMSVIVPASILGRDYLNIIYEDFLYMTLRYIAIQIVGVVLVYLFVKEPGHYAIYTAIYTFTISFGYVVNLFYTRKYAPIRFTIKLNLKKHLVPILILFCGQVASIVYIQSDITMVGIFKSDSDVGVYTLASKIYILSKSMIYALTAVAIPRIVYFLGSKEIEKYNTFASRLFDYLFSVTVPFAAVMFVFGREVILLIGGVEYKSGATSLQVLSIALLVAVFAGFFCNAILVPNRQEKRFLFITVLSALINVVLNIVLIPEVEILGAAITTLVSEMIVVLLAFKDGRKYFKLIVCKKNLMLTVLGTFLVVGICISSKRIIQSSIVQLAVAIPFSTLMYFIVQIIFKNDLYSKVPFLTFLKRKNSSC